MLRLFKVMDGKTPKYFKDKVVAKRFRDNLIESGKDAVVMRGPDHYKGESFNVSTDTPGRKTERR